MKDLLAEFLPRFAASASERLGRARALVAERRLDAVGRELHTLAGEAAVLGLRSVAELARRGEVASRTPDCLPPGVASWEILLDEIERAVALAIAAGGEPGQAG